MRALTQSRDARAGLVAAVLGAVYLVAAFQIEPDPSTTSVVGPQVAPLVIGFATVLCALALVVRGLRRPDAPAGSSGAETESAPAGPVSVPTGWHAMSQQHVLVVFGILAAYIVAFIPLGYLLSTFAFLVGLTTYVERNKLLRNCVFAAVFSGVVYVLFNYGLRVTLPPGLLG